jgi:Tfp pilus assembly protein FimV
LRCRPTQVSRAGARHPITTAHIVASRASARPVRPSLHLTRRGRLVALLLLLAVLTVAFSVGRVTSTALGDPSAPAASTTVQRGDTVWSIAERIAPDADPRKTAIDLMAVNGLGTPELQVGQTLRLP